MCFCNVYYMLVNAVYAKSNLMLHCWVALSLLNLSIWLRSHYEYILCADLVRCHVHTICVHVGLPFRYFPINCNRHCRWQGETLNLSRLSGQNFAGLLKLVGRFSLWLCHAATPVFSVCWNSRRGSEKRARRRRRRLKGLCGGIQTRHESHLERSGICLMSENSN